MGEQASTLLGGAEGSLTGDMQHGTLSKVRVLKAHSPRAREPR